MLKAVIFDVDNTLIDWKDEFIFALRDVLRGIYPDISDEKIKEIDYIIDRNEDYLTTLTKDNLLKIIQDKCDIILPNNFIDLLIDAQGNCYYEDERLVETIDYLSKKYDLYVISNWFTETQKKRLKNVGIDKYFKFILGSDENYFKPDKRCFDVILDKYKPEECVYIGDNFNLDIIPSLEVGMSAIWKTKQKSDKYNTIETIYELKGIL